MAKWSKFHDESLKAIKDRNQLDLEKNLKAIGKDDINAWHKWRDGEYSLLFHAVIESNKQAFESLLNFGADPTLQNSSGNSVLQSIMKRGWTDYADASVAKLTKEERERFLSQSSRNGWTPLMSAAENNQIASAEWLVRNGAYVNAAMGSGWTALHAAAKKGNYEIIKILLENGGDPTLEASHRDFGRNLKVEDVTIDDRIIALLNQYQK